MSSCTIPPPETGRKPFRAWLPETLDLLAVMTAAGRPDWYAYAAWMVSQVTLRQYIEDVDEDTFVPLAADFTDRIVPSRIRRRLLDILLDNGALECDGQFSFGTRAVFKYGSGKAFCYRLGDEYYESPVRTRVIAHAELERKMDIERKRDRDALTDPVHIALEKWHRRVEVLPHAPADEHHTLSALIDGERRFKPCDQGRLHTNIANLPAQYRQFIRLEGRELKAVDIATSQPLLLGVLLSRRESNPGVLCCPSSDESLRVFLDDCLQGVVYDRVCDLTGYSRDDVKGLFLAVIYGHPDHMGTKVGAAVEKLYPAVFRAVVDLNSELGHGGLPRLLQRLESQVMIQQAAGRLLREKPSMPVLTVHDSVLVPEEFVPLVEQVIREEWSKEFGIVPNLKVSDWTAPQPARVRKKRRKNCRRRRRGTAREGGVLRPRARSRLRAGRPPVQPLRG